MKSLKALLFPITLFVCLLIAGPACAESTATVQSFRVDFNLMLDKYEIVFQRTSSAKGLQMVSDARQGMLKLSDEQLAAIFEKSGIPDVSEAVKAAEALVKVTPSAEKAPAEAEVQSFSMDATPFPAAPSIIGACDGIAHSSEFTFGALIGMQVARTVLAAAEFACQQMVVILGEGANTAAVCIPFAIAVDVAAIPYELADFCGGEEDSALLQGSYDRLEHIHNDLGDAQTAIINNANSNTTTIINNDNTNATNIVNNDNTNTTNIIANDNSNRTMIITNDNTNTTNIVNNDNANKELIINELRALGCEIVRLLNTPDGLRASSILSCTGKPSFPYSWNRTR